MVASSMVRRRRRRQWLRRKVVEARWPGLEADQLEQHAPVAEQKHQSSDLDYQADYHPVERSLHELLYDSTMIAQQTAETKMEGDIQPHAVVLYTRASGLTSGLFTFPSLLLRSLLPPSSTPESSATSALCEPWVTAGERELTL